MRMILQLRSTSFRWVICALLFGVTTVNFIDRAVLAVLKPVLPTSIGWTATQFGNSNATLNLAYAFGFLFAGRMIDRIGTRLGHSISLIAWSLAAASHAFAINVGGFTVARLALGSGEAGNSPTAAKTIVEWFPKKNAHWPQASSTPAPTWVLYSHLL